MREMKKSEEGIKITQYMLNEEGERRLNNTKDKKGIERRKYMEVRERKDERKKGNKDEKSSSK